MKAIPAGQFKARCLRIMDEVRATREPVIITKKGRPVAKLVPADKFPKSYWDLVRDPYWAGHDSAI